ncbi:MAG: hypothetical protein V4692_15120, partial [Bdellovibrionota bacterium]
MKQYRFNSAIVVSLAALFALVNCVHSSKQVVTSGNESETGSEFPKPYYETDFTENLGPKRNVADANKRGKFRVGTELCGKDQIKLPRVMIDMRPGYCVGIAASEEDGLIAPRTIAQIPNSPHFIVVDFGGWQPANNGKVFRLEQVGSTFQLKVLFKNLDQPHGLAIGLDGKAYVATHNEVFRFDPLSDTPGKTVNTIVRDLPGKSFTMLSGMKITENSHPLKQIVFDKDGNLYINIGGP